MQIYPPGTRIGQYETASPPMMGGMGVVYFALDHGNDGHPVALKTFRPELLPDRAARDRFLREGTAWVKLGSHPHIVRCYKVEYIDPTAFLVLELIAKEQNMPDASLRSWLIPGHLLPLEQALLFALQIARGMQYATEKIPGFVHRDLKPENILVGADKLPGTHINRLRVTDFGLVKSIVDSGVPETTGNVEELKPNQIQFTRGVGTPLYMSPEQWRGESVGVFTDLYAFGCMLYEMLVGNFAAEGETIAELQASHCSGRIRALPMNLSRDLLELVTRCLQPNPSNRYRSWNEIIEILDGRYRLLNGDSLPRFIAYEEENRNELIHTGLSYITIGYAYKDIGQAQKSIQYYEKAMAIGETENQKELMIITLNHMGQSYKALGDLAQAILCYERALSIINEGSDQDATPIRDAKAAVLNNLGFAYGQLGNAWQGIKCSEEALSFYREVGNRHGEESALSNIGTSYMALGDMKRGIEYLEQALTIDREILDRRGEAEDLGSLGDAYRLIGDYQRALEYYENSLLIRHEIGDYLREGVTLSNLGSVYREMGNLERATEHLERALTIMHEIGNDREAGIILCRLGMIYEEIKDLERAIENFQKAKAIFSKAGDKYWEGLTLGNLGNAYKSSGDITRALEYYEQSLLIGHQLGNMVGLAPVYFNMATLYYYKKGDHETALPLAEKAAQIWSQIGSAYLKHAQELIDELRQIANQK